MLDNSDENKPFLSPLWRVRLFDGPRLENQVGETIKRFRSQRVGGLLAYLALHLGHPCSREEVGFAIWPEEEDTQIVNNRLRVALASLRHQLEPPEIPFGTVLDVSQPGCVCLREEAVWCDVTQLENAYRTGDWQKAQSLSQGTLLPGFYDDWCLSVRDRLEDLYERLEQTRTDATPLVTSASTPAPTPVPETPILISSSLPLYLTRSFGRESERQHLLSLLRENRLVTITGTGGMGKTRIAVETARNFPFPVTFVALAESSTIETAQEAILHALGVPPAVEADLTEQIVALLQRRSPLLLILDNAEHLLETVAELAFSLLQSVSNLNILVTSRQRLNLAGETLFPLAPLEVPTPDALLETLSEIPAVALFLDRAKQARPDFVLSPRHTAATIRICQMLEGAPLALELAAARIVTQTPTQIAESLTLDLLQLKSQQRGFSVRHRSLRASIQGSYDLLSPELKRFLAALSLFQGGWTLEAANFLTESENTEAFLEELTHRSLVVVGEAETGAMRFRFLESIRQFAHEQLSDSDREALVSRHADYFLRLAAGVTDDDFKSFFPLDEEQENLLSALETGWKTRNEPFWQGLCGSLIYGFVRGRYRSSLFWADRALSRVSTLPEIALRTRLRFACYQVVSYAGKSDLTQQIGDEIRQDSEANQFPSGIVLAGLIHGFVATTQGKHDEAQAILQSSLNQARRLDDKDLIRRCLRVKAWILHSTVVSGTISDPEKARQLLQESEIHSDECLSLLPEASISQTYARLTLANVLRQQGQIEEGYRQLKRTQQTALQHGMQAMMIFCLLEECRVAILKDRFDYAALFVGAFLAIREKTGYNAAKPNPQLDIPLQIIQANLGKSRYEMLVQHGGQLPLETLVALTLEAPLPL